MKRILRQRISLANREMEGFWSFAVGSESPFNVFGQIILFPFSVLIFCMRWLVEFLFKRL